MGRADVDRMLDEIPSPLLTEWMAYDQLDPIGEERGDYLIAMLCSVIVNSNPYRGKDSPVAKAEDFMPFMDQEERKQIKMKRVRDAFMSMVGESNPLVDKNGRTLKR
jgi:hypothetical protein